MALPFTTIRHHSSSSVFLTYIIYSADFCYLVTAQERTGSARQWYTRRRAPFPLACFPRAQRSLLSSIMISTWYFPAPTTQATRSLHWLCRRLKKQNIDPTINSTDSSILNRPCAVSFYIEDFRETWTRKFHHRDFCFLKSPWCVRNPAYLPIKSRERPQIAIIWLFDRCISLNSTYSKMIYYEIGSKRSLRIRKAKWQRRTNYITQATVWSRTRVTPCCQIIQKKSICQNFQYRTYLSSKSHKRFRPIFREYGACCSEFYVRYRR